MAESYRIYLDVPYSDIADAHQRGARFDKDKKLWYTSRPDHPATQHWPVVDPDARYYPNVPFSESGLKQAHDLGARWDKEAHRWYTLRPDHPALERWPEPKIRADLRAGHQRALDRSEQVHAWGDDAPNLFPDGPSRLAIDPEVGARPRPDAFSPVNIPTARQLPPQTAKAVAAVARSINPEVANRFLRLRNTLSEASTDPVVGHVRLPNGQESGEYFREARERVDMAIERLQAKDHPRPSAQRRAASPSDDVLLPAQHTLAHLYRQSQLTPLEGLSAGEKPVTYGDAREDLRSTIDYTRHLAGSLQESLRVVPKAVVTTPTPALDTRPAVDEPAKTAASPALRGPTLRGPHR